MLKEGMSRTKKVEQYAKDMVRKNNQPLAPHERMVRPTQEGINAFMKERITTRKKKKPSEPQPAAEVGPAVDKQASPTQDPTQDQLLTKDPPQKMPAPLIP